MGFISGKWDEIKKSELDTWEQIKETLDLKYTNYWVERINKYINLRFAIFKIKVSR